MVTRSAGWRREYRAACSRTAGRMCGPSSRPAQPPIRMRSGRNRLMTSDRPAPRYSAVSSRTSRATGSAATAAASRADRASSSSSESGASPVPPPRSAQRASRDSAPVYASRHPSAPHRQRRPRTDTVRCPHSSGVPSVVPPSGEPSVIRLAPTPEPNRTTTASRAPRPAPNHISAWPSVRAPLSMMYGTSSGRAPVARSSASSGTASQPMVCPCTTAPPGASRSTMPGTPTPTPSSRSVPIPASASTAAIPVRTWSTIGPTS